MDQGEQRHGGKVEEGEAPEISEVEFAEGGVSLSSELDDADGLNEEKLEALFDIPLEVSVRLGKAVMTLGNLLKVRPGTVIELDRLAGEPVDLLINGMVVGSGTVVAVEDRFGIRVTDILRPEERLKRI